MADMITGSAAKARATAPARLDITDKLCALQQIAYDSRYEQVLRSIRTH